MNSPIEMIAEMVRKVDPIHHLAFGRIKAGSVDETKGLCIVVPDDGSPDMRNVRMQSMFNPTVLVIPDDNSKVLCGFGDNQRSKAVILSVEKIRKIRWLTSPAGTMSIEASDTGIKIELGAGKVELTSQGTALGDGTEPMVLGNQLQAWGQSVDLAIATIVAWGATVTPPLSGVIPPAFTPALLSQGNKVS